MPEPRPAALIWCMTAELIGTFILVFFGCGAVHAAVLTGSLTGLWQVGAVWGVSIMLAIYTVGAISGAHINPAITLGFAAWGLFPKRRVPAYMLAQFVGAFLAAAALYTLYSPQLAAYEKTHGVERGERRSEISAMCYGEYFPNPGAYTDLYLQQPLDDSIVDASFEIVPLSTACIAELLGTAILAFVVVATTDPANVGGPKNLAPVFIGLTVAGLICFIAPLTQACFNPARDFGPRTFAYLAGWGRIAFPGPRGCEYVYLFSPIVGSILGVGVFRCLVRPAMLASGQTIQETERL